MKSKIFVLILVALMCVTMADAATYYVSSSTGSDSNAGTSSLVPWKTLSKAYSSSTTGDTIYLLRGDIWYEQFYPPQAGMTIDAYGDAAVKKPIISARDLVVNATVAGSWIACSTPNVWSYTISETAKNDPRRLWVNGTTELARITRKDATDPTASQKWGYIASATTASWIHLYATDNPANVYTKMEMAGARTWAVSTNNRDNTTFRNLELRGGRSVTVECYADNFTIENCDIYDSGLHGILAHGAGQDSSNAYGGIVRNCNINARDYILDTFENLDAVQDGIRLNYGCHNWEVNDNKLYNWGHTAIYLTDAQGTASGYYTTQNNLVHGNVIDASGIDFGRGIATDGGAGTDTSGGCFNNYFYDNIISNVQSRNQINGNNNYFFNNIIDGVLGVEWRTDADTGQGVTFEGYTPQICKNNVFSNNLIMNTVAEGIGIGFGGVGNEVSGNIIENNIIYNTGLDPIDANAANKGIYYRSFITWGNTIRNNSIYNAASANSIYYKSDGILTVANFNGKSTNSDSISNNVAITPGFVDDTVGEPANYGLGNYALLQTSGLINLGRIPGIINPVTAPITTSDYAGNPRPRLGYYDIGPLEYYGTKDLYVSSSTGNDTTNTGAVSTSPWASISKINSATLQAGDTVNLKSGDTFRERLLPLAGSAGTVDSPIQIKSYGTGDGPKLNGADLVTTWTDTGQANVTPDTLDGTFETGNLTQFSSNSPTNGTITVGANAAYRGSYGARIAMNGTGALAFVGRTMTAYPTAYMRMYVRFDTSFAFTGDDLKIWELIRPINGANQLIRMGIRKNGAAYQWYAQFIVDNSTQIYNGDQGPTFDGSTWYKIELYYNGNDGGSESARLLIHENGRLQLDSGKVTGQAVGTNVVDKVYFGSQSGNGLIPTNGSILDIDDCAIDVNEWIGESKPMAIYQAAVPWDTNQIFQDDNRLNEIPWDTNIATTARFMGIGTWTQDITGNLAYVWATDSADPDTHTMEVSKRDSGFYGGTGAGIDYITVNNIHGLKTNSIAGLYTGAGAHVTIQNCTASQNYERGIHTAGTDAIVENCVVFDNYYGIRVDGDDVTIRNNISRDNRTRLGADGIHIEGLSNNTAERLTITGNTVYGNNFGESADNIQIAGYVNGVTVAYNTLSKGRGVIVTNSAAGSRIIYNKIYSGGTPIKFGITVALPGGFTEVYNNTIYLSDLADAGIKITGTHTDGVVIRNNVVHAGTNRALWHVSGDPAQITLSNNAYYNTGGGTLITWNATDYTLAQAAAYQSASGKDGNSIFLDPLFRDAANADFHLRRVSPLVGAGYSLSLTRDFDNNAIPYGAGVDIGAFEMMENPFGNVILSRFRLHKQSEFFRRLMGL